MHSFSSSIRPLIALLATLHLCHANGFLRDCDDIGWRSSSDGPILMATCGTSKGGYKRSELNLSGCMVPKNEILDWSQGYVQFGMQIR